MNIYIYFCSELTTGIFLPGSSRIIFLYTNSISYLNFLKDFHERTDNLNQFRRCFLETPLSLEVGKRPRQCTDDLQVSSIQWQLFGRRLRRDRWAARLTGASVVVPEAICPYRNAIRLLDTSSVVTAPQYFGLLIQRFPGRKIRGKRDTTMIPQEWNNWS